MSTIDLKWGDQVTAAINPHRTQLPPVVTRTGVVHSVLPNKATFFVQLTEGGRVAYNRYLNLDDENITWTRGHHAPGSPEARELLKSAIEHHDE